MRLKVKSFRAKLIILYSILVSISFLGLGVLIFWLASNELKSNLDKSLLKVANSLDYILKENIKEALGPKSEKTRKSRKKDQKQNKFLFLKDVEEHRFVGPLHPKTEEETSGISELEKEPIWSAIYEHILLNPKNYYIQISDTSRQIVWKSDNLRDDTLQIPYEIYEIDLKKIDNESQEFFLTEFFKGKNIKFENKSVYGYFEKEIRKQATRLIVKKSDIGYISVAYSLEDIEDTLRGLLMIFSIGVPFLLLTSIAGGFFLSKWSLKTIEDLTKATKEITAKNLSKRLPVPEKDDEIGRLTQTINEMIERLESSFEQIRRFTSDASHELRTPLTILRGELELALSKPQNEQNYQMVLASALEEVARLTDLVNNLLELSRADAGQVILNKSEVNLTRLVQDIVEDAVILAEQKNIIVDVHCDEDVKCIADGAKLHQALLNIIDNAIKYTDEGGVIKVFLNNHKDNVEIVVSDTGIGIPENDLPHIFERFYRVDKARSHKVIGTGLGLAIAKSIVDAHDGKIDVKSELNKGTTFTITLPKES